MPDSSARRSLGGVPRGVVQVPERVRAFAAGRSVSPVWRNQAGGVTFFVPAGRQYIKWSPAGGIDLEVEADRLRWARTALQAAPDAGIAVPQLISHGSDPDGSWLVTAAIPARSAVDSHWLARPAVAAAAIGSGLRRWHDLPSVERCPYSWSLADRLTYIRSEARRYDPRNWHSDHQHLSVRDALNELADPPEVDRLVVCHGDACSPNTLIDDSGRARALVDLGSVGVADRWADLAIATWSVGWSYGPGFDGVLLDAYGIDPDPRRTAYYRLLWDLGP